MNRFANSSGRKRINNEEPMSRKNRKKFKKPNLTEIQMDSIDNLFANGMQPQEIADHLKITRPQVHNYIRSAYRSERAYIDNETGERKKARHFSDDFKKKVIEIALVSGNHEKVARRFNVTRKNVQTWVLAYQNNLDANVSVGDQNIRGSLRGGKDQYKSMIEDIEAIAWSEWHKGKRELSINDLMKGLSPQSPTEHILKKVLKIMNDDHTIDFYQNGKGQPYIIRLAQERLIEAQGRDSWISPNKGNNPNPIWLKHFDEYGMPKIKQGEKMNLSTDSTNNLRIEGDTNNKVSSPSNNDKLSSETLERDLMTLFKKQDEIIELHNSNGEFLQGTLLPKLEKLAEGGTEALKIIKEMEETLPELWNRVDALTKEKEDLVDLEIDIEIGMETLDDQTEQWEKQKSILEDKIKELEGELEQEKIRRSASSHEANKFRKEAYDREKTNTRLQQENVILKGANVTFGGTR